MGRFGVDTFFGDLGEAHQHVLARDAVLVEASNYCHCRMQMDIIRQGGKKGGKNDANYTK